VERKLLQKENKNIIMVIGLVNLPYINNIGRFIYFGKGEK